MFTKTVQENTCFGETFTFFADIIKNNDAIKIYGPPKGLPLIGLRKFCFYF